MLVQRRNRLITPRQRGIVTPRAAAPATGLYAEFPGDEIIDCHFKSKEPPDHIPPGTGEFYTCGTWYSDGTGPPIVTTSLRHHTAENTYPGPLPQATPIAPTAVDPRTGPTWQTGGAIYLTGAGIFFNPYKRIDLDPPGWTLFVAPVVGYEINYSASMYSLSCPRYEFPTQPCNSISDFGTGLATRNKTTEGPDFTLFGWETNAPESPNFGDSGTDGQVGYGGANTQTGGAYYDVTTLGEGIVWAQFTYFVNFHCTNYPDGCWYSFLTVGCCNNQFGSQGSFSMTAICRDI